ncbi:MAG: putative toxin-antitoxin system toxin component, PIN family [candidate division NC10 bacterium]|nr:putative toxin-antitoxin system toxin component, PIN family [candidate division NC10 bacterium]
MPYQIVIDTNVLVAALRSRRGASFRVLSLVGGKDFGINISVPLVLEYEDAAKRIAREIGLSHGDIDDILDYICRVAHHCQIYFLWRPFLKDPRDDLVLEVAVEGGCDFIVTYNVRDFEGADRFGVRVVTPGEFLRAIGALP